MKKYCNNSWQKIVKLLNSNVEQGLDEKNCQTIGRRYGKNKIELHNKRKIYDYVISLLKEKSVIIYILITSIFCAFKNYIYAGVMGLILLSNIIWIIHNNVKRNREINKLKKVSSTDAVVIRNGIQKNIKSEDLVIGDIVLVYGNCIVPADLRIINSENLRVDESNVTGEKLIKNKSEDIIVGSITSITQMKNILFKGSVVKSGDGLGVVVAVGPSTQLAKNMSMLWYSSNRKHNFGRMIYNYFDKYLILGFGLILAAGCYFTYTEQHIGMNNMLVAFLALGFCPMLIIWLLGSKKVEKFLIGKNIKINNFSMFNLIEDINVLFIDKVGAISKKEMIVKNLYINDELISTDDPYIKEVTFDRIVEISLICNNGVYDASNDTVIGEIDEAAFLKYAARKKVSKSSVDSKNSKITEISKDLDKQFTTVLTRVNRGCRANSRGSVDAVLERCTHIMIRGIEKELTEEYKTKIKEIDMNLSLQGLITQGFAYRNFGYEPSSDENIESNMVFVGLIGLENPLEDDLERALNNVRDKGILPILFTEEGKLSAINSAKRARIIKNSNQVIAGIELDSLNEQELKEVLCRARVFCKVNSEIKSKIVSLFIKDGYRVATTGEDLEDLYILNLSNVGISKGNASTMVKNFSDVYIKDNYLKSFLKLKKFAKGFRNNIERVFKTSFMMVLSEIFVLLISSFFEQANSINIYTVIAMNGILIIPISLMLICKKGKDISKREIVFRAIIISAMCGISMYKVEDSDSQFIPLTIISTGILIFTMFKAKISLRKKSSELMMAAISLVVIILSVAILILINNKMPRDIISIEICASILFLLIFEILCGKWQDSLMR